MKLSPRLPAPRTVLAGIGAACALGVPLAVFYAILRHRVPAAEQASFREVFDKAVAAGMIAR